MDRALQLTDLSAYTNTQLSQLVDITLYNLELLMVMIIIFNIMDIGVRQIAKFPKEHV